MNINRKNYEAFMLDLIEGGLTLEEESALFNFLDNNPDLDRDLPEIKTLNPPHIFINKESLAFHQISDSTRKYFYISSLEGQLSDKQEEKLKLFLKKNVKYTDEYKSFCKTILVSKEVVYPNKKQLHELAKTPIIRFSFYWYLKVASVVLLLGVGYTLALFLQNNVSPLYVKSSTELDLDTNKYTPSKSNDNMDKKNITEKITSSDKLLNKWVSRQNSDEKLANTTPYKIKKNKEEHVVLLSLAPRVVFPAPIYLEKSDELTLAANLDFDNNTEELNLNENKTIVQRLSFGDLIAGGVSDLVSLNNNPIISQQNLSNKLADFFGEKNYVEKKEGKHVKTHVSFGKFKYERIKTN